MFNAPKDKSRMTGIKEQGAVYWLYYSRLDPADRIKAMLVAQLISWIDS